MPYCSECGQEIDAVDSFCKGCGAAVETTDGKMGHDSETTPAGANTGTRGGKQAESRRQNTTPTSVEERRTLPLSYLGVITSAALAVYGTTKDWTESSVSGIARPEGARVSDGGIEVSDVDATAGMAGMETWAGPVIFGLGILAIALILWDIARRSNDEGSQVIEQFEDWEIPHLAGVCGFAMALSFFVVVDSDASLAAGGWMVLAGSVGILASLCIFWTAQNFLGEYRQSHSA